MKVKIFRSYTKSSLENNINWFIKNDNIIVKEIQFQTSFGELFALITYEEK